MFKLQFALKLTLTTLLALGVLEQSTAIAQTTAVVPQSASSHRALVQNDWSFWPSEQNRAPRRTLTVVRLEPQAVVVITLFR